MPARIHRGHGRKHWRRASNPKPAGETKHLEKIHVKRDDVVEVISGVDKGKRGKILRTVPSTGQIVVEGVNRKWKHLRRSQETPQGGRLQRESPIHACKVKKV